MEDSKLIKLNFIDNLAVENVQLAEIKFQERTKGIQESEVKRTQELVYSSIRTLFPYVFENRQRFESLTKNQLKELVSHAINYRRKFLMKMGILSIFSALIGISSIVYPVITDMLSSSSGGLLFMMGFVFSFGALGLLAQEYQEYLNYRLIKKYYKELQDSLNKEGNK